MERLLNRLCFDCNYFRARVNGLCEACVSTDEDEPQSNHVRERIVPPPSPPQKRKTFSEFEYKPPEKKLKPIYIEDSCNICFEVSNTGVVEYCSCSFKMCLACKNTLLGINPVHKCPQCRAKLIIKY